jgi:hypothetical protein
MNKNKHYTPITDYISFEDLLEKSGYKKFIPHIGNVGRAILSASKHHRSISWLKNQLDVYFSNIRNKTKDRKENEQRT